MSHSSILGMTHSLVLTLFSLPFPRRHHSLPESVKSHSSMVDATHSSQYVVATISRLLKIIGLFCRISSLEQGSFAEETIHFK